MSDSGGRLLACASDPPGLPRMFASLQASPACYIWPFYWGRVLLPLVPCTGPGPHSTGRSTASREKSGRPPTFPLTREAPHLTLKPSHHSGSEPWSLLITPCQSSHLVIHLTTHLVTHPHHTPTWSHLVTPHHSPGRTPGHACS